MSSRIDNIQDDTIVEVFNDYHSSVSYKLDRVTRSWDVGAAKKIRVAELYEAVNIKGGRFLFEEGILLIKDAAVRRALGLSDLDEYSLDQDKIVEMLNKGTNKELEDVLMYCSETTLTKIVQKAIEMPISDMNKANLIKSYSGIDILSVIQEKQESQIDKEQTTEEGNKTPVRRKRVATE